MLKSIKLLTLILLLFAYNIKAQNFIIPNMPDSFEVGQYNINFNTIDNLKELFLEDNFIINLNELITLSDSPKFFTRVIDKPQNTPTFRIGMDTTGYAMNDGFWRYFCIKNNSIYYTGRSDMWYTCNSFYFTTMYLEKPVLFNPLVINNQEMLYDTSTLNLPIFKRNNQFSTCDSAKINGFFYSNSQNLNSGKIVFQTDTIDVQSVYTFHHDSIIINTPTNGAWQYNSSKVLLNYTDIRLFVKNGTYIPIGEISGEYRTLNFINDKRLRTPTGVKTISQPKVNLFPNPVKDVLNIEGIDNTEMFLYDAQGRMVWEGKNVHQIQMQNLSEGIYHLSIKTDSGFLMKKVVKE